MMMTTTMMMQHQATHLPISIKPSPPTSTGPVCVGRTATAAAAAVYLSLVGVVFEDDPGGAAVPGREARVRGGGARDPAAVHRRGEAEVRGGAGQETVRGLAPIDLGLVERCDNATGQCPDRFHNRMVSGPSKSASKRPSASACWPRRRSAARTWPGSSRRRRSSGSASGALLVYVSMVEGPARSPSSPPQHRN